MPGAIERCASATWRSLLSLFLAMMAAGLSAFSADASRLVELANVGPWPSLSKPIAYDGRLWFVNSVLGVNHNSADVYSYDPMTKRLRYERHLFSQDAGDPLVANGLLYWPSEDSRFSIGWGDLVVTNGRHWTYHVVPTAQIFHIHALAQFKGRLVAASSAWRAGLQESHDGGATWTQVYDHPTPPKRVSRIVDLAATTGLLFAHIIDRGKSSLIQFDGTSVNAVPDWPSADTISGLTTKADRVYALVAGENGTAVWTSDGRISKRLSPAGLGWRPRDIASDGERLWIVGPESDGGAIWKSADGRDWREVSRFNNGVPEDLLVVGGDVYVFGTGSDGQGVLWGPPSPSPVPDGDEPTSLPRRPPVNWVEQPDWDAEGDALVRLIGARSSFANRAVLRDRIWQNVVSGAPASIYGAALDAVAPDTSLSLIGGNTSASASALRDWIVLWGMAAAGRGQVPLEYLVRDFGSQPNPAEKYFDPAQVALWTVGEIGQDDRRTIDALIVRLVEDSDPDWLVGDIVGTLYAVTGQQFAYDTASWRKWWLEARGAWPSQKGSAK